MISAALPRRFGRPFLLLVLAQRTSGHGYELYEAIAEFGVQIDLAGVYRDLRTMEQHDLLSSTWAASGSGPDRRVYELTDAGRDAAVTARRELVSIRDQLAVALDAVSEPVG